MKLPVDRGTGARIALIALLAGALGPGVRAGAGESGSLAGRVFEADGRTPRGGVMVALVSDDGVSAARSNPTTGEGAFAIERADPGSYRLLVETTEGAFVTAAPVAVASGVNPPLALSLSPGTNPQTSSTTATSASLPEWAQWAIAGGIAVVALFVIIENNNDEDPASNF